MRKKGYTLVEVLVGAAIIAVLVALLLPVFGLFGRSTSIQDARVTKAETIYERYGKYGSTEYMVFTDKGAFSVKPSIYGQVKIGQVYDVEAYGWEPMYATKFVLDVSATNKVKENE